jgi:hypothetical protein
MFGLLASDVMLFLVLGHVLPLRIWFDPDVQVAEKHRLWHVQDAHYQRFCCEWVDE